MWAGLVAAVLRGWNGMEFEYFKFWNALQAPPQLGTFYQPRSGMVMQNCFVVVVLLVVGKTFG